MMEKIKNSRGVGKRSLGRKIFIVCNTIFLLLCSFTFLAPYINILAKSFNAAGDTMLGGVTFYPREFTWENYDVVLKDPNIGQSAIISLLRVIFGSLFSLFLQYSVAYVLLRKGLPGRSVIVMFFTIPMFISGGLIAEYIIYAKLNLYNNFLVYILPHSFSFYNMVIIRTYLMGIPESLLESARLDGAGEITILFKIMLPLSMPIVATILLWCAVAHWNDWARTLYFIDNEDLYTLQYRLLLAKKDVQELEKMIQNALESGRPLGTIEGDVSGESIQAAQTIITTVPIVLTYPFFQRYFVSGVTMGSVKE
ncbi:MAG: carbohydrate ABC transporter permease [Clostridia bacterium]|nr:carbohydrate ABC transporter permease [Clostridia bacterium]